MITVDARGQACPEPVILTKKAMEENPQKSLVTIVDNIVSANNVEKLGKSRFYTVRKEERDNLFYVHLISATTEPEVLQPVTKSAEGAVMETTFSRGRILLLSKDYLGEGSEELGRNLMKTFLYALGETYTLPRQLLLINGAVRMTATDSPCLPLLVGLAEKGVAIEICGICLDFYGLKESLSVGHITNMYTIVETLTKEEVVVL